MWQHDTLVNDRILQLSSIAVRRPGGRLLVYPAHHYLRNEHAILLQASRWAADYDKAARYTAESRDISRTLLLCIVPLYQEAGLSLDDALRQVGCLKSDYRWMCQDPTLTLRAGKLRTELAMKQSVKDVLQLRTATASDNRIVDCREDQKPVAALGPLGNELLKRRQPGDPTTESDVEDELEDTRARTQKGPANKDRNSKDLDDSNDSHDSDEPACTRTSKRVRRPPKTVLPLVAAATAPPPSPPSPPIETPREQTQEKHQQRQPDDIVHRFLTCLWGRQLLASEQQYAARQVETSWTEKLRNDLRRWQRRAADDPTQQWALVMFARYITAHAQDPSLTLQAFFAAQRSAKARRLLKQATAADTPSDAHTERQLQQLTPWSFWEAPTAAATATAT
jgi:hypothetical protein